MSLLHHQKLIYTGQIISAPSKTLFDAFKMQNEMNRNKIIAFSYNNSARKTIEHYVFSSHNSN